MFACVGMRNSVGKSQDPIAIYLTIDVGINARSTKDTIQNIINIKRRFIKQNKTTQ